MIRNGQDHPSPSAKPGIRNSSMASKDKEHSQRDIMTFLGRLDRIVKLLLTLEEPMSL